MTFAADGLPGGLQLDPANGRITGALTIPGEFKVTLRAKNSHGTAEKPFSHRGRRRHSAHARDGLEQLATIVSARTRRRKHPGLFARGARAMISSGLDAARLDLHQHGRWLASDCASTRRPKSRALQAERAAFHRHEGDGGREIHGGWDSRRAFIRRRGSITYGGKPRRQFGKSRRRVADERWISLRRKMQAEALAVRHRQIFFSRRTGRGSSSPISGASII